MKNQWLACVWVAIFCVLGFPLSGETVRIDRSNGLMLSLDVYRTEDAGAPVILLFHQAGFSRGEYRETAPELNKLGFNCIAADQRSGKGVNGVENMAFREAKENGMKTGYADAFPDLEAVLKYAQKKFPSSGIIVLGSSYSASLIFVLADKYSDKIAALIAFSPGEYFKYYGKEIKEYAKSLKCPVFITSAKSEYGSWKAIYDSIPNGKKSFFLPEQEGVHGSRALWKSSVGHESCWDALKKFLKGVII